jgi:hypothetical protein
MSVQHNQHRSVPSERGLEVAGLAGSCFWVKDLLANDQPLALREWLPAFARWLNAPPPPQLSVENVLRTNGADAVYDGTQMRGVSNAKAKHELTFRPRPLEWVVDTAPTYPINQACPQRTC